MRRLIFKIAGVVLLITTVLSSCKKDEQSTEYSYFISKELAVSYSQVYINSLINAVSGSVPEVSSFKQLINSDVNIYRIVYKTTVNVDKVNVSGLVCVPVEPGEYPVLSFQNGTNTLNANSPSKFPINYPYQMIEIMASMGYIVVIADYPGFGESSNIPHPYLVKEPTVQSLVDMLYSVKEMAMNELPGISLKDEYYLLGYSQGGWATLALHKALELEYSGDFNLKGSACGAGPYDISLLLHNMISSDNYPMPVYLGYILSAYISYGQFTNPVTDIFNEPYASKVSSLYSGMLTSDEINQQLTTSVEGLLTPEFLSGFASAQEFSSVRDALERNSITPWKTNIPLLLIHGGNDTQVDPVSTESMYDDMIQAGTSPDICRKVIVPGVDHGDGVIPCMMQGILFLQNLHSSE